MLESFAKLGETIPLTQSCPAKRIQHYQATRNPVDPLIRESQTDVNAFFRWSLLRNYYTDIGNVGKMQLI